MQEGSQSPGFQVQVYHLLAVWYCGATYLSSLNFGLPFCKMGIRTPLSQGYFKDWDDTGFAQYIVIISTVNKWQLLYLKIFFKTLLKQNNFISLVILYHQLYFNLQGKLKIAKRKKIAKEKKGKSIFLKYNMCVQ